MTPFPNVIMKTEKGRKEGGGKIISINHFPESEKILIILRLFC